MNIKISTIISKGERVTLECKKAQRSVPYSLWDTYSAFANTYGGTILLGIVEHMEEQDKSKRFEIVAYGSKWVFFSEKNTHSSSYRSFWVLNPL